jgi:hypothetical protein
MPGDLRLPLTQNLNKVADTDLAISHQVEQAKARCVGKGREETSQIYRFGAVVHSSIIYALTNMIGQNIFA